MAYEGYRLKINGVIFPDSYMEKGSYQQTAGKRVVEIWRDANLVEHEITTGVEKAEISFSVREHSTDEHDDLIYLLRPENGLQIEFWDDLLGDYRTGSFRRSKITFKHRNVDAGGVVYAATPVTLTED